MDNIDLEVLKTSSQWLAAGLRCELVTVLKTWGSSPRPEGSMLAICEDGRVVGSVSGGCIEDDMTPEELARLHGPIGLYIGSKTPPEIAISILAELTAVKNGVGSAQMANVAAAKGQLGLPPTGEVCAVTQ